MSALEVGRQVLKRGLLHPVKSAPETNLGTVKTMILIFVAVVCGLLAFPAVQFAANRNAAQPLEFARLEELELVKLLVNDPACFIRLGGMVSKDTFTHEGLIAIWGILEDTARLSGVGAFETTKAKDVDRNVAAAREACSTAFFSNLRTEGNANYTLRQTLSVLGFDTDAHNSVVETDAKEFLKVGSKVLGSHEARKLTTDRAPIEPTGDLEIPWRRVVAEPRISRFITTSVFASLAGFATMLGMSSNGISNIWAGGAVVAFVTASVVVSLVDWDTFYVDFHTLGAGALSFWALMVGAAGSWTRISTGVIATVVMIVFFEVFGRLYLALRGKAMGGGDTWIAALSCGAASAITGTALGAILALLAGCFSMIGYFLVLKIRDGASSDVPVAFGPHLLIGLPIAVLAAGLIPA